MKCIKIKVEISSISQSVSQVYRVDELPANVILGDILDDILGKLRSENFKFSSYHITNYRLPDFETAYPSNRELFIKSISFSKLFFDFYQMFHLQYKYAFYL